MSDTGLKTKYPLTLDIMDELFLLLGNPSIGISGKEVSFASVVVGKSSLKIFNCEKYHKSSYKLEPDFLFSKPSIWGINKPELLRGISFPREDGDNKLEQIKIVTCTGKLFCQPVLNLHS